MESTNPNEKQEDNHNEIDNLLLQAKDAANKKDLKHAVSILFDASNKLTLEPVQAKDKGATAMHGSTSEKDNRLIYYSKLASIYYSLSKYDESMAACDELEKLIPQDCRVYKQKGDINRKYKKYDDAKKMYQMALDKAQKDDSSSSADNAAINNGLALCYFEQEDYNEACEGFKLAIEADDANPLYYCNQGNALYLSGKKTEGIESFKKSSVLLKKIEASEPSDSNLTKMNLTFIQSKLDSYMTHLENIHKQNPGRIDPLIKQKEEKFVHRFNRGDSGKSNSSSDFNFDTEAKSIIEAYKRSEKLTSQQCFEFYGTLAGYLAKAYNTAGVISKGEFKIPTAKSSPKEFTAKVVKLIPLIGEKLGDKVDLIPEYVNDNISKIPAAGNLLKLGSKADDIFQLVAIDFVTKYQKKLESKETKDKLESILPIWISKYSTTLTSNEIKKEDFEKEFYGADSQTAMQRFGQKIAYQLVEKYIASGKIYEDGSDYQALMLSVVEELVLNDLDGTPLKKLGENTSPSPKKLDSKSASKSDTKIVNKKSKRCEIF